MEASLIWLDCGRWVLQSVPGSTTFSVSTDYSVLSGWLLGCRAQFLLLSPRSRRRQLTPWPEVSTTKAQMSRELHDLRADVYCDRLIRSRNLIFVIIVWNKIHLLYVFRSSYKRSNIDTNIKTNDATSKTRIQLKGPKSSDESTTIIHFSTNQSA